MKGNFNVKCFPLGWLNWYLTVDQRLNVLYRNAHLTMGCVLDAIGGLAKVSPLATPRAERLPSSNSDDDCHEEEQPSTTCILPAVLRDRPHSSRAGRGVPPPVPPRSPRRPHDSRDPSLMRGE